MCTASAQHSAFCQGMPCCSAEAFSELPALQLVKAFLFSFLVDGFNYPLVLDGSFFDTSTRSLNFSLGADCAVMYALSGFFAYVTFNLCHFWPLASLLPAPQQLTFLSWMQLVSSFLQSLLPRVTSELLLASSLLVLLARPLASQWLLPSLHPHLLDPRPWRIWLPWTLSFS